MIATEFLGHDVLLTIDPPATPPRSSCASTASNPPPIDAKVRIEVVGQRRSCSHERRILDRLARATATNVAVLTDSRAADVPPTRRRRRRRSARTRRASSPGAARNPQRRRALWCTTWRRWRRPRRAAGPRRTRPHRDSCRRMSPTSSSTPTGSTSRSPRTPPPAPRPRPVAVHLGQHRLTEAGAAVAPQSGRQRRRHRRIPRHPRNRQGSNDAADVVLLRPVGDPQPPAARRRPDPHRALGRRRRVLGAVPPASRHRVRRRALHLRAARPHRLRGLGSAASALRHPGRRADATRARAPFAELGRRRAGSCS